MYAYRVVLNLWGRKKMTYHFYSSMNDSGILYDPKRDIENFARGIEPADSISCARLIGLRRCRKTSRTLRNDIFLRASVLRPGASIPRGYLNQICYGSEDF